MSVVRRCPNCGTTQTAAGECKACHEAQVRYYCTNHEPGLWIDGPTCPQCAARSAPAPARVPAPAPAPARPVRPRAPTPVAAEPREDTARPALWKELLRGAVLARAASSADGAPASPARGWLTGLLRRLVVVALLLAVGVAVAIYAVAHSLG